MLGSIPIFTKARVGGALLTVEECSARDCGSVGLQFGAGTWPDQVKGLNRFGATQEIVRVDHGRLTESSYCGFMTASREANLSQAEQAFRSSAQSIPVTVGYGTSSAAGTLASVLHKAVAATFSWADCPKLMDELRDQKPPVYERSVARNQPSVLPTFLYAVREAILSGLPHTSTVYTHNGEIYSLTTETRSAKSGEIVMTGRTSGGKSHGETEFRLWTASGSDSDLPARIEFRARNFLKLTLELDRRQTVPVFEPILKDSE